MSKRESERNSLTVRADEEKDLRVYSVNMDDPIIQGILYLAERKNKR